MPAAGEAQERSPTTGEPPSLSQTPSQTIGPYFAYGLTAEQYRYPHTQLVGERLAEPDCPGEHITVTGQVLDGEGEPVDDAMIEIVQADADGRLDVRMDERFRCLGRSGTGTRPDRRFEFRTVKPGVTDDGAAPHASVCVFMRGLLTHCYTRIYFSDEAERNAADPTLRAVPEDRRGTLVAERQEAPEGIVYRFDIHMQGPAETVFLDV